MIGKTIACGLQKGGVAKTTTTLNLSAALAMMGYKVLMIDNDPQASLTFISGYQTPIEKNNIIDIYDGCADIHDLILPVECCENLFLIPSHINLSAMELSLISKVNREYKLQRALAPLKEEYDFILIDCPPSLNMLNVNAVVSADGIICCCEPKVMAVQGLLLYNKTIANLKYEMNLNYTFLGVVITRIGAGKDAKDIMEVMEKNYPILGRSKELVITSKGDIDGIPLVISNPSHINSLMYKQMAEKIIDWRDNS